FASTAAGVAFDVGDGRAGFPASLIGPHGGGLELKVEDGSLRIRSTRTAARYLGDQAEALVDADGFVDTADMLERRGDRYYFVGRRDGIINVGGQKVHPEEVEAIINGHPRVRMSLVRTRKAPITKTPDRVLPTVIDELAAHLDEAPALLSDRESLTYRALTERANRYGGWALEHGIGTGDAVALFMPNRPEYLAIWLGVTRVGGVVAPLNTNLAGSALAHCIDLVA